MLYLAEVKKQTRGLIGNWKTELKLLAFQRDDQTWNTVPNEELVSCEYGNSIGEGALLFVNLNANREVQGNPELGGGRVVRILQYFSRMLEKAQEEQEAIDDWKQSLTYQGQELSRRREELEAQIQEIEAKEEEFANIEQRRQEIEESWRKLEEYQKQIQDTPPARILEQEESNRIKQLISNLGNAFRGTDSLKDKLDLIFRGIQVQDDYLRQEWNNLDKRRNDAQNRRNQVEEFLSQLKERQQELSSTQKNLEQAKIELEKQQSDLRSKEERLGHISVDLHNIVELRSRIKILFDSGEQKSYDYPINLDALQNISIEELNEQVDKLEKELEKWTSFVNDQEEELNFEAQTVLELEQKLNEVEESEKDEIRQDLADAQERKKMMERTLEGQRLNVHEKKDSLEQYRDLLQHRQIFEPTLSLLEMQHDHLMQEKQKLESDVEHLKSGLNNIREMVNQQSGINQARERELEGQLEHLLQLQRESALLQGQVETYEAVLQPWQSNLNEIRQQLIQMQESFNQVGVGRDQQGWFGELEQVLNRLDD